MAIPNWKMHHIIETKGAVVVAEESCTRSRYFQSEFGDIKGETIDDLLEIIADRYLGINCACFTPNDGRKDDIINLAREYNVDGIVLYTLNFCQAYEIESIRLEKAIKSQGLPVISVSMDYSSEDNEQINTRIEAFLEMIKR